jgi:hypothetical protein
MIYLAARTSVCLDRCSIISRPAERAGIRARLPPCEPSMWSRSWFTRLILGQDEAKDCLMRRHANEVAWLTRTEIVEENLPTAPALCR